MYILQSAFTSIWNVVKAQKYVLNKLLYCFSKIHVIGRIKSGHIAQFSSVLGLILDLL